mgnify:CR=1 FL=1
MPIDYKKYPSNWKTEIRPAILKRADNRCEFCGVDNYSIGFRNSEGVFVKTDKHIRKLSCFTIKIVLTIAHLNHDINDNRYENLKALCQKCHNQLDAPYRASNRKNKLKK